MRADCRFHLVSAEAGYRFEKGISELVVRCLDTRGFIFTSRIERIVERQSTRRPRFSPDTIWQSIPPAPTRRPAMIQRGGIAAAWQMIRFNKTLPIEYSNLFVTRFVIASSLC